ncbi:hypothetical protein ECHLIB_0983 [Ehrlichia chaffeensis str. Liberty]|nr:hypothetical protein ECHJAX_0981 [Ehrlichia chaffeensis str. Jax]AHX07016.1 hypothetical protein ECHLIB_0983 [Ehrlichia chaffeensis str. Liberty]
MSFCRKYRYSCMHLILICFKVTVCKNSGNKACVKVVD